MYHRKCIHPNRWAWGQRIVDIAEEHFELRYGSAAEDGGWDEWLPIALVGHPHDKVFGVQFLISRDSPESAAMMDAVIAELDFYLLRKGEHDPWAYAQYHSTTRSNVYSPVHWSFYARGYRNEALH